MFIGCSFLLHNGGATSTLIISSCRACAFGHIKRWKWGKEEDGTGEESMKAQAVPSSDHHRKCKATGKWNFIHHFVCSSLSYCLLCPHLNLIYVPLLASAHPSVTGLCVALFNAHSDGTPEKRCEMSAYIEDNAINIMSLLPWGWSKDHRPGAQWPRCQVILVPLLWGWNCCHLQDQPLFPTHSQVWLHFLSQNLWTCSDFCHTAAECFTLLCALITSELQKQTDSTFSEQFPEFLDSCCSLPGQLCVLGSIHYDCPHDPLTTHTTDILNMYSLQQTVVQSTHRQATCQSGWLFCLMKKFTSLWRCLTALNLTTAAFWLLDMPVSHPLDMHRLVYNICGTDHVTFKETLKLIRVALWPLQCHLLISTR